MKIFFYWSPLCPRCRMARRSLKKLIKNYQNAELVEVDVVTEFKKTAADGIRLFPAIKIADKKLAGILLSSERIESFLDENLKRIQ